MTKTITLTDIRIDQWVVDVEMRRVMIYYRIVSDNEFEDPMERHEAIFWENKPEGHQGGLDIGLAFPQPDNWFDLPAKYVDLLTDLTRDAKAALLAYHQI